LQYVYHQHASFYEFPIVAGLVHEGRGREGSVILFSYKIIEILIQSIEKRQKDNKKEKITNECDITRPLILRKQKARSCGAIY
jgi:hypothetical protein